MSKETIDLMWERLAQHQPVADERGYGEAWRRMCEQRTDEAAWTAMDAAWDAAGDAADAAEAAGWAARWVAMARASGWVEAAEAAEAWAKRAIEYIEKAEENK